MGRWLGSLLRRLLERCWLGGADCWGGDLGVCWGGCWSSTFREVLVVGVVVREFVAEVVGAVLVGVVLIVGAVVGEFVGEVVGAVLVGI